MRGKERYSATRKPGPRITPACAGKSRWLRPALALRQDHPRMCGEKDLLSFGRPYLLGSPPHVRGKVVKVAFSRKMFQDHPRMCGEKQNRASAPNTRPGSPPHVRGKVELGFAENRVLGITPACAGKRLKRSRSTVPPVAIVPLFPSVCNKPVVSDGSPAGRDAPLFLPAENAVPASPAYNLRSL